MAALHTLSLTWDEKDRPVITVQYTADEQEPSASVEPDEWLEALVERLTDESADKLRALIDANNASGAVALGDLATRLGVDKKKIDGWNRNLGRSIKAVVRDYGFLRKENEDGTAQVFDFEWDQPGNRWLYTVPERFRAPLIAHLDKR